MAIIFFVLLISLQASAQNEVAIGSSTTKSNAILWLNGNGSQGLILPVVTNKSAVSNPDKGMVVFDDSDDKVYYHSGANWVEVGGGGGATSNPSLLLEGNQLQLKDGTTVKSTVNLAAGTQSNGAFLVFTGGSWQYATLSGDVTGANGALQVNGVKGKTIPTLPTTTQALVYDGTAWKFQALTAGTDSQTLTFTSPNLSISNGNSVNLSTLDKDAQTLTLTGSSLSISGGNAVTLPGGTLTSVTAGTGLTGGTITNTGTINVDVGTTANKIVQLDATGKLPAVDGSQLTNLSGGGDITGVTAGTGLTGGGLSGSVTIAVDAGTTANKIVQLDATGKLPAVDGSQLTNLTGDISAVTAGTGLTGGATTGAATLNVDVGTTANKIVQLDAAGKLPAIDGSQLTNLVSATIADGSITGGSAGAGVKIAANTITDANILSLNAGKITSGTLPLAQVPNLDASKITTGTFTTAQIPNLDASKITSGVLPTTQGGTGISFSSGSIGNGQLLIGNSGSFAKANLTSGAGINITNGAGIISIATNGNFGSQNLTTSGTLNAGATTVSALTINGAAWPANASGVLTNNGSGTLTWTPTGGTGTVTSVGLAMPSIFTVTNSPITTSGTLTTTLASQTAATVFAAPPGAAGVPTFRGLLSSDIPNLDASKITTGSLAVANGGTGSTTPAGALTNLGALSSTASAGGDLTGTFSNLQLVTNSITNTDISPTAAILGTKIDPSFGGLNISTTGTLTAGATTLTSLVVPGTTSFNSRVYTWPNTVAAANTYLRNDGSGNLSWTTVAGGTDLTAQNGILQGNGTAITGLAATTGLQYLRRNSGNTAFEFAALSSSDIPNLDATKITSGTLPVSVGGTGRTTWDGLLLGSGSTISDISTGAAGLVLKVVGTSPSWGLITDSNIDPAAAISGSKIIPNFGTQALTSGTSTTFGTLSYTWPGTAGAANSVLTNDGAGALSWAAGGWGLAGNALAGGEVLGSTNGNPLSFITNNVERMRITPSGNVGIGTTSPNAQLQFSNSIGRKIVLFEQANNDNQFIGFAVGGFGTFESQIPVNSNSFVWKAATSSTTSNELMRITGTGNVGIGTTAPISKLDVAGDLRLAQITAPSTTTDKLYNVAGSLFWNGTNISSGGSGWSLSGNPGTDPLANFIGTTDAQPLRFSTGVGGVERMRIDAVGKIGIGVIAPTAGFDMLSNDGMAVKGTYASGVIPSTGAGTRMMFYPKKAAFRVGRTFNDTGSESANWDDANIGDDSFAAGQNTIASGTRSFAVGKRAVASGSASVAMGDGTLASRFGSVAMGFVSEATGQEAFAVGRYTQAESRASVAIGHYNVGGGDPLAFNVTDPLFEIGNGTDVGVLRSNAFTVLRNGKTSIGGINPQVMLEVKGTDAILLPVGTTAQRPSTSVAGYFRYNSSNSAVEFNNGSSWQSLGGGWTLTGNSGTVDGTSFIGTTDFVALNFRVGGLPSGRIDPVNIQANTFLGYSSGSSNTGTLSTGFGYQTLQANTGSNNTAIGSYSMITNSSGFANTAAGGGAMRFNTTGAVNTAIGVSTLYQNTTGNNNTALGGNALNQNTTGSENTAVGTQAMQLNLTGIGNTATGFYALINTTGSNNVAYGLRAGEINTSGSDNTFIGYYANASANNLINATAIGSGTTVDASNKVRIGNASVTVIQGQVGFTAASDRRLKTDIQDIGLGIDFIKKLRPVTYLMKAGDSRQNWGFIAQDIEALVGTDKAVLTIGQDSLRSLGLRYTDFIAPMVNAMQEQQKMIEDQQKMIDSLQARDAHSKKQIASLEASLQNMQSTDSEMQKLKAEIETIKKALGLAVEASLPAKKEEKKNEQ